MNLADLPLLPTSLHPAFEPTMLIVGVKASLVFAKPLFTRIRGHCVGSRRNESGLVSTSGLFLGVVISLTTSRPQLGLTFLCSH